MTIQTTITLDDFRMCTQLATQRAPYGWQPPTVLQRMQSIYVAFSCVLGSAMGFTNLDEGSNSWVFTLLFGTLVAYIVFLLAMGFLQQRLYKTVGDVALGHKELTFSPDGIEEQACHSTLVTKWQATVHGEETPTHLYVFLNNLSAFIIPKRDLTDTTQADRLRMLIQEHVPSFHSSPS